MSALSSPGEGSDDRTLLTGDASVPDANSEYSIYLNLKQPRVLSKRRTAPSSSTTATASTSWSSCATSLRSGSGAV